LRARGAIPGANTVDYFKLTTRPSHSNTPFTDSYVDLGEEDDWTKAQPGMSDEEEEEEDADADADGKKRKKGGKDDSKDAKRAKKPEVDKRDKQRLANMFAKNAAAVAAGGIKRAPAADTAASKPAQDADSLLEDILGGIGGSSAPVQTFAKPAAPPANQFRRPAPHAQPPSVQATPATLMKPSMVTPTAPKAASAPAVRPTPRAVTWAPEDETEGEYSLKPPLSPVHSGQRDEGDAMDADDAPAAVPMDDDDDEEKDDDEPPSPAAAAAAAKKSGGILKETTVRPPAAGVTASGAAVAAASTLDAAADGWAAVFDDSSAGGDVQVDAAPAQLAPDGSLPLDADDTLPFFLVDAHEDIAHPGTVFLFGRVPVDASATGAASTETVSACAVVTGMQRCMFVVPRPDVFDDADGEIESLERTAAEAAKGSDEAAAKKARGALLRTLQTRAKDVKDEVREILLARGIESFTMKPVKRSYCFERDDIPRGCQYVLKVRCPAAGPALPVDLKGRHFVAVLGASTPSLEHLVIKSKVMGPTWISIHGARLVPSGQQKSWCKLEVTVDRGHKSVRQPATSLPHRDPPTLTVAALNLKTVVNHRANVNEIASASVVYARNVKCDQPTPNWNSLDHLRHFSIVRRLDGVSFPPGWDAAVAKENAEHPVAKRTGSVVLSSQSSERGLLSFLLAKLQQLDADVLVGHNIAGFDLDVLLHRLQANKVPHWSRVGRLKRTRFPNLGGGGNAYGGGAGIGALSCLAGRLLADTYLSARDFVKEVSYTLTALAKNQLGRHRVEVPATDIPGKFSDAPALMGLAKSTESDAWLSLGLMFHLSVLPLTRQLSNIAGNLWSKTLQHTRAQRVEYLLLHEFHARKFLLPDKLTARERKFGRGNQHADADFDGGDFDGGEGVKAGKKRGGAAYAGGLVLEPKKGLYDKYVLMMDFNSLYPSIIQEYNICFTTVAQPRADPDDPAAAPPAPTLPTDADGTKVVLPQVIKKLVDRRREVKNMIKTERNAARAKQLDIRQMALKLTANSMYGCLGFAASRFYAKPLAELVTLQGREILQSTVDLAQGNLGRNVIYGDTDSIMINTESTNIAEVVDMAKQFKKLSDKRFKVLEIEMDGLYKSMLLLKKKKYAALMVKQLPDGSYTTVIEQKGLDIVRRDWSPLAKEQGNLALKEILSGNPTEDVVEGIHETLRKCREDLVNGAVTMDKFIITKQLTKRPEDYPDAANQAHVQVALRLRAAGKREGVNQGETVPYVIALKTDASAEEIASGRAVNQSSGGKGLADRAYHPDEVSAEGSGLKLDLHYYLTQQVHPVVSRLCQPIEGTDAAHIANCLGLDPSKFHHQVVTATGGNEYDDDLLAPATALDDEERFKRCKPLVLRTAGGEFEFPGVDAILAGQVAPDASLAPAPKTNGAPDGKENVANPPNTGKLAGDAGVASSTPTPLGAHALANQVRLAVRDSVNSYYSTTLRSDDELAPSETRNVSLRVGTDAAAEPGTLPADPKCQGAMQKTTTEAALYTQLVHFRRLLDYPGALARMPPKDRDAARARMESSPGTRAALDAAAKEVERTLRRSAYRWVNLRTLFGAAGMA